MVVLALGGIGLAGCATSTPTESARAPIDAGEYAVAAAEADPGCTGGVWVDAGEVTLAVVDGCPAPEGAAEVSGLTIEFVEYSTAELLALQSDVAQFDVAHSSGVDPRANVLRVWVAEADLDEMSERAEAAVVAAGLDGRTRSPIAVAVGAGDEGLGE